MSYNFHIGQDVVCIKNDTKNKVLKDNIYTVKALKLTPCCSLLVVDVGVLTDSELITCSQCGGLYKSHNERYLNNKLFAPLDELTDISELQEVLEQPLFQVK